MPIDATEETARRVDELLARLRDWPDSRAAAVAEELTGLVHAAPVAVDTSR